MTASIAPRDRMIHALERRPPVPGPVPHFELAFFPAMEAFGKVHPYHRNYRQWDQMGETERRLHRKDMARFHVDTAERFDHAGIFFNANPWSLDEMAWQLEAVREAGGDRYFVATHGDCTFGIPSGADMTDFCVAMAEEPQKLHDEARRRIDAVVEKAEFVRGKGLLDGFGLCADYAMNNAPFFSPAQFAEFVAPYLREIIGIYREMGYYTIKHSDGCLWPILDQIADANPHALHSIDPQGGMDIAEVKRRYGGRLCLIGNVNCGLMDTGTDEEVLESCRYALRHGMPGGGYIYSTSNCVYTGMRLARYELMLKARAEEGVYA